MDYQQAIESTITIDQAITELSKHGIVADYNDPTNLGTVFDATTGEDIATIRNGAVAGADVLNWLGY